MRQNSRLNTFFTFIATLLVAISTTSCITVTMHQKGNSSPSTQQQPTSSSRGNTGTITLGAEVAVASQSISNTSGGTIAVSKPGDPLDGFVLGVPPNSYSNTTTFKLSYAPITNQTFGNDISPITPMIKVDNGGGYSEELMNVRVPVKVPDGYFAMGFLYDDKTKQLEGMPIITMDAESITVSTRHFSDFFISMILKTDLSGDIDSGYRPGIDDWQFGNPGSYIAPGGYCAGSTLTAMWYYYTQPDGKDLTLYGRYDNNGIKPATPNLMLDDSRGIRFASVIQADGFDNFAIDFWKNLGGKVWQNGKWEACPGVGDNITFSLFAYSILATHQPQYISVHREGGSHAIICYRVKNQNLYIADPNYPGDTERRINFSGAKLEPYSTAQNQKEIAAGNVRKYETIIYVGKSTIVNWNAIGQRWSEFQNGTIGNNKFPQYRLVYLDETGKWQDLQDGMTMAQENVGFGYYFGADLSGVNIYRDGELVNPVAGGKIKLEKGDNLLGFFVQKSVGNEFQYVDFKYLNVKYGEEDDPILAKLQKTTKFRCQLLNLPCTFSESDWSGQRTVNRNGFFYVPGNAIDIGGFGETDIKWSGTSFTGGGMKGYPDKLTGYVSLTKDKKVLVSFDYVINDPKNELKFSIRSLPVDPKHFMDPGTQYKDPEGLSMLQYMSTDAPALKNFVTLLEWKRYETRPDFDGPPVVWDYRLTAKNWAAQCGFGLQFR